MEYKLKIHPSADYEVIIYVKGYAPDTGDTSHNIKLAMARANAVIQYLTSKKSVDQQSEPQKYVSQMNDAMDNPTVSKGRLEQLRSENVEVELPICGFQDESGSGYDLNEIGLCKADKEGNCKDSNWRIKVINVNDTLPADCNPAEVIKEDFNIENIFDPQDPRFNMVKLDVAVYDRKKQKFYQFRKAEKIEGTDR